MERIPEVMEIRTKIRIKIPIKKIRDGSDFLTDILFPRRCPVCGDIVLPKGNLICPGCMAKLSWVRRPVCKKCGKEVLDETIEYCCDCTRHKRSFDYGLSLINYDDTASRSMARIKYNNRREYLDFYSEAMVRKMGKRIRSMDGDALIPVPVHPSRRRERGFNQAEELARRLSGPLGIPVNTSILKRERKTAPAEKPGFQRPVKEPGAGLHGVRPAVRHAKMLYWWMISTPQAVPLRRVHGSSEKPVRSTYIL